MEEGAEEIIRLQGVIKILEDQLDQERRAYIDEKSRFNDELHKLNTTLMRIRHSAADFADVMSIIREYETYWGA